MIGWIIGAFLAGKAIGLLTAAIITGKADDFMEWRKRKHEQKKLRNYIKRTAGDHRGADLAERRREE